MREVAQKRKDLNNSNVSNRKSVISAKADKTDGV